MPYTIRTYDQATKVINLPDGVNDASTSLTFVGKNVSNFGQKQNENFLYLLENFAGTQEPANKLRGQIWYDTNNYQLKFYDGGGWQGIGVVDFSDTQPTAAHSGYLWFDTTKGQLFVNSGVTNTDYTLIGPDTITGFGTTRLVSKSVKDLQGNTRPTIQVTVDGEILGVISTATFTIDSSTSSNAINGFNKVTRGITLKNYDTYDVTIFGRSASSAISTEAINLRAGTVGSIPIQSASSTTAFISLGSPGQILVAGTTTAAWTAIDLVLVGNANTATNLAGGAQGSLPYQSAPGVTSLLAKSNNGYILTQGATQPVWTNPGSFNAGYANTATGANTLLNGSGTAFISASTGTVGYSIAERTPDGDLFANLFRGVAVSAQYADLAEKYLADQEYEVGTVMIIGGEKEVTASTFGKRAIGVVSNKPAYLMNKDLENGTIVALKGRVPVKVIGSIKKGDNLVSSNNGYATSAVHHSSEVFAISLETNSDSGPKLVEAVVL